MTHKYEEISHLQTSSAKSIFSTTTSSTYLESYIAVIPNFKILNPKRLPKGNSRSNWFPYYAGFSPDFVLSIMNSFDTSADMCIADPWNGGGTTTTIANALGFESKGVDLNPVMLIASKACLLNNVDIPSILPITDDIIKKATYIRLQHLYEDPLNVWLTPDSVVQFRRLEKGLKNLLLRNKNSELIDLINQGGKELSSLTCFYYIGLFRALRNILKPFLSSNPTWIKVPKQENNKLNISSKLLYSVFRNEIHSMIQQMHHGDLFTGVTNAKTDFAVANSELLPWDKESIDLIITSPPYCTRIDYAIATMPELAILGKGYDTGFEELRRKLIGATTVPKNNIEIDSQWGESCTSFLNSVYNHDSRASKSYYYKSHVNYFSSMFNSIKEISRVLKKDGVCVMVVQDSFYKDIHNDLPKILSEMAHNQNMSIIKREDFSSSRTMATINPQVKKYRSSTEATESVICFQK